MNNYLFWLIIYLGKLKTSLTLDKTSYLVRRHPLLFENVKLNITQTILMIFFLQFLVNNTLLRGSWDPGDIYLQHINACVELEWKKV